MNFRQVLLILSCTIIVSGATALITVQLMKKSEAVNLSQIQIPVPIPQAPPSAATQAPSPTPKVEATYESLDALQPPPELKIESEGDRREPLKPHEAIGTILKDTPACADDYMQLCTSNAYMAEHPLTCLRHYKDKLSQSCYQQVRSVRDEFIKACQTEIEKYCPQEKQYFPCLKKQASRLSNNCRIQIQKFSRN